MNKKIEEMVVNILQKTQFLNLPQKDQILQEVRLSKTLDNHLNRGKTEEKRKNSLLYILEGYREILKILN